MRWAWVAPIVAVVALGVMLTGGCSGPGVDVAQVQSADLQDLAANNVSAVVLVRSWVSVLYAEANKEGGCDQVFEFELLPDGSIHMWGTNSDCSTYDYIQDGSGAGSGTITYPDGVVRELSWSAPRMDGGYTTQDIRQTFRDGTVLDYTFGGVFNSGIGTREGTAVLPDGRSMDYSHTRDLAGTDDLRLGLPDGSSLQMHVPFGGSFQNGYFADFDQGATGAFTAADGSRLDFDVSGTGDRGETWRMTGPGGTEGTFALGEDFEGTGRLERDGQVACALRWQPDGDGILDMVDAGSAEVTPSAAARDFQVDRWISTIAAMGPAPMY